MLDKNFRPAEVETKQYADWERRGAFAADPEGFRAEWSDAQAELAGAIASAEGRLAGVRVPDELYAAVARVVLGSGVHSHRADIAIIECARAAAALDGRGEVTSGDVLAAAALALGHRLAADPFAPAAEVDTYVLQRLLEDALEVEVSPKKAERATP